MTPIIVTSQLGETFKLLQGNRRSAMNSNTSIYLPAIQIITIIITSTFPSTYQIHTPYYVPPQHLLPIQSSAITQK
jgi:hypothetical protein